MDFSQERSLRDSSIFACRQRLRLAVLLTRQRLAGLCKQATTAATTVPSMLRQAGDGSSAGTPNNSQYFQTDNGTFARQQSGDPAPGR